jgi:hypothetical protein
MQSKSQHEITPSPNPFAQPVKTLKWAVRDFTTETCGVSGSGEGGSKVESVGVSDEF